MVPGSNISAVSVHDQDHKGGGGSTAEWVMSPVGTVPHGHHDSPEAFFFPTLRRDSRLCLTLSCSCHGH